MLTVAIIPFVALALAFLLGVAGLVLVGIWHAIRAGQAQVAKSPDFAALPSSGAPTSSKSIEPAKLPSSRAVTSVEGEDLRRTPVRIAALERQLSDALNRADQQSDHLKARRGRIADKEDRAELLVRYDEDVTLLARRTESMRRVMALLWRTRAILELRAHIALSARKRPNLSHLPEGDDIPTGKLEAAAQAYDNASDAVREFVTWLDERVTDVRHAVPRVPDLATADENDRQMVQDELTRVVGTYTDLGARMDRLADTLAYLADRCRTRSVVVAGEVTLDAGTGAEGLLSEVAEALEGLQEMSRLGDRQLADSALDSLAEDISQLERAGMDAQAAAEAELEVARLLERVRA